MIGTIRVVPYARFRADDYQERRPVRAFARWTAEAATDRAGRPVLLLDEYAFQRVTVCTYRTETERAEDEAILRGLDEAAIRSRHHRYLA